SSGTTVTRAAGATGNYTLTLPYAATGITAGTGITLAAPQASLTAPNFANGTRVYAARVQSFTIASTAINTSTDTITLGNDAQGNAAAFATAPPYTQVRFSLNSGATLPTTTGSVLKDGGFYYWSDGKLYTSTANIPNTPIDFTSQGSGNFTLLAETELFNITISGNSGLSQTLNLNTGTLIRLKAAYWAKSGGIATAGAFFDNRDSLISWSATGGVAIGATVGPTNLEAVHEAIVNTAQIQSNKYGLLSPADSGDTLSQFSIALEGIGTLQINSNDLDGVELIQNIFLWWCWIRSTSEGIRLASYDTLQAINFTSYQAGRVEVENTNASLPLNIAGGSITFPGSSTGIAATSYAINLNADVFGTGATVTTGGISPSATDIRNALGVTAPNLDTQLGNINSKTTNLPASFPVVDGSGRVTVGSLADGAITAAKIADNAITAAKIADNAIDADAIAASAVTELQANLATQASVDALPNAPAIADAVWDEALSGHTIAGSTGKKLADTSTLTVGDIPAGLSAQQVWEYTTRALTGTQATNLAAIPNIPTNPLLTNDARLNNLDATISSRSTLTAAQIRTELATELARLDVAVSTRLAAANYTTPPTTSQIATAVEAALLNDADGQALLAAIQTAVQALFDQQADIPVATLVSLIAARITADHGSGSYTTANLSAVALEATAQGIKAKTDNLPSDPADQSELVTLINTKASQASVDAIPTTPLLAANYTAPDNAGIAAIKAKTDNLPSDPADQSELVSLINTLP
ncbi:MAG: hypothetical protein EBZ77_11065, partial [Chitinophagia bacterium]|nr:hypothetical protein [Chitinophagia bacterium]